MRLTFHKLVLTAVAGLAALTPTACGEDEDGADEDFTAEVGALCEQSRADFVEASEGLALGDDEAAYEEAFRKANEPVLENYLEELEQVEPPEDVAADYERFIELNRKSGEALLADPAAFLSGALNQKENKTIKQVEEAGIGLREVAEELDLPAACTGEAATPSA